MKRMYFAREKYGFIVRTNAGEASREEIEAEAKKLEEQYLHLLKTAPYRTCFSALKTSEPVWIEMLRNTYTADLTGDGKLHAAPVWDFDVALGNYTSRNII